MILCDASLSESAGLILLLVLIHDLIKPVFDIGQLAFGWRWKDGSLPRRFRHHRIVLMIHGTVITLVMITTRAFGAIHIIHWRWSSALWASHLLISLFYLAENGLIILLVGINLRNFMLNGVSGTISGWYHSWAVRLDLCIISIICHTSLRSKDICPWGDRNCKCL